MSIWTHNQVGADCVEYGTEVTIIGWVYQTDSSEPQTPLWDCKTLWGCTWALIPVYKTAIVNDWMMRYLSEGNRQLGLLNEPELALCSQSTRQRLSLYDEVPEWGSPGARTPQWAWTCALSPPRPPLAAAPCRSAGTTRTLPQTWSTNSIVSARHPIHGGS